MERESSAGTAGTLTGVMRKKTERPGSFRLATTSRRRGPTRPGIAEAARRPLIAIN